MRILATSIVLAASLAASPALAGPFSKCGDLGTKINALGMDASRSFTVETTNSGVWGDSYKTMVVWVDLTDANSSITRFDMTCTASDDDNTTDYEPQECAVAAGVCTSSDAGIWQKATPASSKWVWRVDVSGFPDTQCTFSVGAGSGAAADVLTVKARLCEE